MNGSIFTCNSCGTEFKTSDLQRYHMKTEWHRYNLKRRMAQLPPITADEFAEKLQISQREQEAHQTDEFGFAVLKSSVGYRRKDDKHHQHNRTDEESIATDEGFETLLDYKLDELELKKIVSQAESVGSEFSHLTFDSEQNHTDLGEDTVSEYSFTSESNYGSDYPTEEADTDDDIEQTNQHIDNELSHTRCLFCRLDNRDVERNVRHMFRSHGLYIPERSYLVDLPGLLDFLINTIVVDYSCLCCNYVGTSLKSIRDHMNSKRHCRMPYETAYEKDIFAPFYDYSLSVEKPVRKAKTTKKIHFEVESDDDTKKTESELDSMSRPNSQRLPSSAAQRHPERNMVTAQDRRMISGVTEKQYKNGLKKMQQLEKRAQDDYLRKNTKRMNFQAHYRDELLQ